MRRLCGPRDDISLRAGDVGKGKRTNAIKNRADRMATKMIIRSLVPGYSISEGAADFCLDRDSSFCSRTSVDGFVGSCFSISASLEATLSARWCVSSGFSTDILIAMAMERDFKYQERSTFVVSDASLDTIFPVPPSRYTPLCPGPKQCPLACTQQLTRSVGPQC